jgi:hypothetical protein
MARQQFKQGPILPGDITRKAAPGEIQLLWRESSCSGERTSLAYDMITFINFDCKRETIIITAFRKKSQDCGAANGDNITKQCRW